VAATGRGAEALPGWPATIHRDLADLPRDAPELEHPGIRASTTSPMTDVACWPSTSTGPF
jgi:hypothetical protein